MAQKLENYTFPGRENWAYPWDEWTDGSIWKLFRGFDFQCKLHSMAENIRKQARYRDMDVLVKQLKDDNSVVFRFIQKAR